MLVINPPQKNCMIHKKRTCTLVPSFGKIHRTWAPQRWLSLHQNDHLTKLKHLVIPGEPVSHMPFHWPCLWILLNIDVDGRKTAAGRASANSAVHVVAGYIVIVGSRMGVGNAHCTVVASCGFMWLPHLPGHLSWQGSTDAQDGRQRRKRG